MATALLSNAAMRGDVKLYKNIGEVWGTLNVKVADTETDGVANYSEREMDIFLGCLKGNWTVTQGLTTEELAKSCSTGNFNVGTNKAWSASINTRNLPPLITAWATGQKMLNYFSETSQTIITKETVTITATTPLVTTLLDLTAGISTLTLDNLVKIISVKRKSDGHYWSIADTAADASRELKLNATSPHLEFEDADYFGDEFLVTIAYERVMEAGEVKLIDDGLTFPKEMDLYLNYLISVETGPSRGRRGVLTVKLRNMVRTSGDFSIGGDAQGIQEGTIEVSQNFDAEGDTEFHYTWIDAA